MPRYGPLLLVIAACAPNGSNSPAPPPFPAVFTFEMQTREMTYEDCVAGSDACTYIRLDYPAVVEVPVGASVEAVTSAIDSFLEAPLRPDEPPSGVNALMGRFLSDYAAFKASEPKSEQSWFLERKAFVLRNTPKLLSLSFSERSFLGGAHGLETVRYVNLDPATGAKISLSDVLKEGALPEATRLGEARFREIRALAEGAALKDSGFTFENDLFALTENFALRDDGLAFYYNPYDIAPFAMGATEIVVSWEEARDLVVPEYAPQTAATAAPQREQ
jgi:Protein of unknown function (DUF3298)/Deacetylase PdaC